MKTIRALLIATLCLFALGSRARADSLPTLTLDPVNGALTGAAGATVGWGFTITNTTNFLVISSSDFCVGPITSPCVNSLGTYTDFAGPQFIVVGPSPESSSVTQAFNNTLQTGMGSFLINSGALAGDSAIGQIVLTYDLFSLSPNDPNFDPFTDTLSNGNFLKADASVTVQNATATPEPGTLLLLGSGLLGLSLPVVRRKRLRSFPYE